MPPTVNNVDSIARMVAGLIGLLLVYVAYALYVNIPEKGALIWVSSSEVREVRYSHTRRWGPRLCVIILDSHCLSLDRPDAGYAELLEATKNSTPYALGYIRDRDIFSGGAERYDIVYAVTVDGVPVVSFEDRVNGQRYFSGGVLAVGILLAALGLRAALMRSAARSKVG